MPAGYGARPLLVSFPHIAKNYEYLTETGQVILAELNSQFLAKSLWKEFDDIYIRLYTDWPTATSRGSDTTAIQCASIFGASYRRPCHADGMKNSNQILYGDRTSLRGKFSQVRPRWLPWPNIFMTRMLTHDLYAVADLIIKILQNTKATCKNCNF